MVSVGDAADDRLLTRMNHVWFLAATVPAAGLRWGRG